MKSQGFLYPGTTPAMMENIDNLFPMT